MSETTTAPEGRQVCPECGGTDFYEAEGARWCRAHDSMAVQWEQGLVFPTPAPEGGEDDTVLCPKCGQEAMYVLAPDERRGQYVCDSPRCEGGYFTPATPTSAEGGEAERCPTCGGTQERPYFFSVTGRRCRSAFHIPTLAATGGEEALHPATPCDACGEVVCRCEGSPRWKDEQIAELRRQLAEAEADASKWRNLGKLPEDATRELAQFDALIRRATTAERRLEELGWVEREEITEADVRLLRQANGDFAQQLHEIDEVLLSDECCGANTARNVGTPDPDLGKYVCMNEDGDAIVDADTPADAIRQILDCWASVDDQLTASQQEVARLREALEAVDALRSVCERIIALWHTDSGDRDFMGALSYEIPQLRAAIDALSSPHQSTWQGGATRPLPHPVRPHTPGTPAPRRDPIDEACDAVKRGEVDRG